MIEEQKDKLMNDAAVSTPAANSKVPSSNLG
jgi:hypothetical protein